MSANFVAREVGYHMTQGWGEGDTATQAYFRPIETFEDRFRALIREMKACGYDAFDLWTAHLSPDWATEKHFEAFHRVLKEEGMRLYGVTCWATTLADVEKGIRHALRCGSRLLTGGAPVLATQAKEASRLLREAGVRYAVENHAQKSADEHLAEVAGADPEFVGLAVDTGWCGTQGFSAAEAIRKVASRLFHVHLKDIHAPVRGTGPTLKDGGHDCCTLGDGVVGIPAVLAALKEVGYAGPISIEMEPEEYDPRPGCRQSLERVRGWMRGLTPRAGFKAVRCVIVGCGNIAKTYAMQMKAYPEVDLVGFTDIDRKRAEEAAAQYGGRVYADLAEVLADPSIELIVNLTIHHVHYEVITAALKAGKHVHSEKPLAMTYRECQELVDLAASKGLRLSSAPITYLGEPQMTAAQVLREGRLGTVRLAYAEINHGRIEKWHPNPVPFYGVGILWDVAVYPLAVLTRLLGPVVSVTATGRYLLKDRVTLAGDPFTLPKPDYVLATLDFENGTVARLSCNFYTDSKGGSSIEFHGDLGRLYLGSSFMFNAEVEFGLYKKPYEPVPLVAPAYDGIEFARGVQDLAVALREGRPHAADARQAAHVVDIIESLETSLQDGQPRTIVSRF